MTGSCSCKGDGLTIAKEISNRVKYELGITVSIGVSWNKIFAKLGSDYKKLSNHSLHSDNYKDQFWPLPFRISVCRKCYPEKLNNCGIRTIGDLAGASSPDFLKGRLGKMGLVLSILQWRGSDTGKCRKLPCSGQSIGNSTTTPRDLVSDEDVSIIVYCCPRVCRLDAGETILLEL